MAQIKLEDATPQEGGHSAGSSPVRGTKQREGGREAQCKGLQIPKTVGSNPTLHSKGKDLIKGGGWTHEDARIVLACKRQ